MARGGGGFNILLILLIIGAGYYLYTHPDALSSGRNTATVQTPISKGTYLSQNSTQAILKSQLNTTINQTNTTSNITTTQTTSTTTSTQPVQRTVIPGVTNQCGYTNYAYPNYIGTQKEGDTCKDVPVSERDSECLSNAPVKYDGELNIITKYSNPVISCCDIDGTCQW